MKLSLTTAFLVTLSAATVACGAASEDAGTSASAVSSVTSCNPGWLYCGEHQRVKSVLQSDGLSTGDVYRCNADRTVTLAERCSAGCEVMSTAENDRCLGAPPAMARGGDDLAVFPPYARSQTFGKDARGVVVPRTAPGSLVKDPSVEYYVLAAAPLQDGATVYSEDLPIDRQGGMCETADKIRYSRGGVQYLVANPDLSAGSAGVRKLLRFDAAVLNAGTSTLRFGGPNTSVDRSTGATSTRLVDLRRFGYSACHAHDHMNGFATYRLLDAAGTPVAVGSTPIVGRKQGFCIGDVIQYGSGASPTGSFVNNRCNDMQLSPGFADVYARQDSVHKRFLGGQWIDVTGVPAGEYAVEIEVNPEVALNDAGECTDGLVKCGDSCRLFCESDYSNNKARASVTIPETPCVPPAINDGGAATPDRGMSAPEATFRQRLIELSASVTETCGAITSDVACEGDRLTAHTTNGCTLRYHWERYRAGGVGQGAVELEVE